MKMSRVRGRKLELICVLCNEALADVERACAGHLKNSKNNHNSNFPGNELGRGVESESVVSEALSAGQDVFPVGGGAVGGATYGLGAAVPNPPYQYGGYMPLTDHNPKHVVATKCGHMFHQGCLRKHVHKTLIEGKGGSLFCPMCTRPFAMNRLWPVVIPPTKAQRDRYIQLQLMKEQNVEMVAQLKDIRAKIADDEEQLKRLKEDSEQCLQDIQQKQNLLDSVNGPTNKEIVELTKIHMKRQEILHVVTQHNADLLKLLAEESNISTATAENMLHVKSDHTRDPHQNYVPTPPGANGQTYRVGSADEDYPSKIGVSRNCSRKSKKKEKSGKSKKKNRRCSNQSPTQSKSRVNKKRGEGDNEMGKRGVTGDDTFHAVPLPSEVMVPANPGKDTYPAHQTKEKRSTKACCKKVDTYTKWNMDSMKDLMYLPGLSALTDSHPSTASAVDHDDEYLDAAQRRRQGTPHQNSVNILLARKPNMYENDGIGGLSKKEKQ